MTVKISSVIAWGLVLVLGQLLVTSWTVHAAGNQAVIDYISFAGTVVSMILAVLAIIYSFITNASQTSDAAVLRGQLSSLNDTIARANVSGSQFASELTRLEEIRDDLSSIRMNSERALKNDEELKSHIEARMQELKGAKTSAAVSSEDFSAALKKLAAEALPDQIVEYYLACLSKGAKRLEMRDLVQELLVSTMKTENPAFWRSYERGIIYAYGAIFIDLGLYEDDQLMLTFKSDLLALAEKTKVPADFAVFDREKLQNSLRIVAERIREEIGEN